MVILLIEIFVRMKKVVDHMHSLSLGFLIQPSIFFKNCQSMSHTLRCHGNISTVTPQSARLYYIYTIVELIELLFPHRLGQPSRPIIGELREDQLAHHCGELREDQLNPALPRIATS